MRGPKDGSRTYIHWSLSYGSASISFVFACLCTLGLNQQLLNCPARNSRIRMVTVSPEPAVTVTVSPAVVALESTSALNNAASLRSTPGISMNIAPFATRDGIESRSRPIGVQRPCPGLTMNFRKGPFVVQSVESCAVMLPAVPLQQLFLSIVGRTGVASSEISPGKLLVPVLVVLWIAVRNAMIAVPTVRSVEIDFVTRSMSLMRAS